MRCHIIARFYTSLRCHKSKRRMWSKRYRVGAHFYRSWRCHKSIRRIKSKRYRIFEHFFTSWRCHKSKRRIWSKRCRVIAHFYTSLRCRKKQVSNVVQALSCRCTFLQEMALSKERPSMAMSQEQASNMVEARSTGEGQRCSLMLAITQ